MLILCVRTDKPEAEISLYADQGLLAYDKWLAHRELAETLHLKVRDLLTAQRKTWHDLTGVVVFKGPGSFTGLRIGITVANALADGLGLPIISGIGDEWALRGIERLQKGENEHIALPAYGSEPHITAPKK